MIISEVAGVGSELSTVVAELVEDTDTSVDDPVVGKDDSEDNGGCDDDGCGGDVEPGRTAVEVDSAGTALVSVAG